MKRGLVLLAVLTGCSAPYDVPTDNLGRPIDRVKPEITTIDAGRLDAEEPGSRYVVRRGDTLFSIAWRFDQDPDVLKRRNQLDTDLIRPGQSLKLKGEVPPEPQPKIAPPPVIKAKPESVQKATVPEKKREPVKSVQKPKPKPKPKPAPAAAVPPLTGWQWPVDGPVVAKYSNKTRFSRSIQLGGKAGSPVKAAASGRVVYAGDGLVGFGNLIIISHEGKFLSAYGHNQSLDVKVGDTVNAGQVIAKMGSTGTDRVKLHFEIRKAGKPINPVSLLPKRRS
jgi:lipoprotein NlpD